MSLFTATSLGVPVSTTHTITGAIVGVGATRRLSAVRWGIAGRIVWAWVLTIPGVCTDRAPTFVLRCSAPLSHPIETGPNRICNGCNLRDGSTI